MKPEYDSASEESEDDAPEAVTLSQSKKAIREQASALHQAQTAEKERKRTKNRERDRKLKEQAASKKGKQVAVDEDEGESDDDDDDDGDAVMARMRKAMREADAESDEEMDDGGSGIDDDDDDAMPDDESDDDEEEFHGFDAPQRNPNHLPDHLFTSAFASQSKPALAKGKSKVQQHKEKQKAKKRFRTKPKDIVVGSRVIRSLKDNTLPTGTSAMGPTTKVRKFLDRTLALRPSGNGQKRGWERRPASVGSLRTSGPAARFVRS